ncbi:glycosyltransferase, partial [Lactiplantibacillus plantarum]|uniref:glycosyltransferase n=1 Tax=Lactiplantibacillus plantarum TaxID=1590 RepID=UPI0023817B67
DIFVLPTRYEGLGISLIEAQINGLPVFTNKDVPKEAVINQNMYLLDKGDSELWVDAINKELNVINLKKRKVNLSDFNQYNIETVVKKYKTFIYNCCHRMKILSGILSNCEM